MNGFNDLKEKLEAQGIAVGTSKNSGSAGVSKNNSPSGALKTAPKKTESNEEKESRLKAELADFLRGSDIFKNPTNA